MPRSSTAVNNPFLQRQLQSLKCLTHSDFDVLDSLLCEHETRDKGARWIIAGDRLDQVSIVSAGWAIRYKLLDDGRRQILNLYLPGDVVGFFALLFQTAEYGVEPLTPVQLQSFSAERAFAAFAAAPRLAVALSWLAGQGERQLDEQIVRVGRRHAAERMAHLFMELSHRLRRIGLPETEASCLPLTQAILADALGMSQVHANRSFRRLVQDALVVWRDGRIQLLDIDGLSRLAGFDPGYLRQASLPAPLSQALGPGTNKCDCCPPSAPPHCRG